MVSFFTRRRGAVMTGHARLRDRRVIHQGGFEETRRCSVANIARRCGGNMAGGLAARNAVVMTRITGFRRSLKDAIGVAYLTRHILVRTH